MSKTLEELGKEYIDYIKINEENIKTCKNKIKEAKQNEDARSEDGLKKTLAVLYEISRELRATSKHLIKYYGEKNCNRIL